MPTVRIQEKNYSESIMVLKLKDGNFRRIDEQIWKDIDEKEMMDFLACAEKIIRNLES